MYCYEPFRPEDIFCLDYCNIDSYSENFDFEYYCDFLITNNSTQIVIKKKEHQTAEESNSLLNSNDVLSPVIIGYCICRIELNTSLGSSTPSANLHICGVAINFNNRRHGLARNLMLLIELNAKSISAKTVDLFVRNSNSNAILAYKNLNYKFTKKLYDYYSDPSEDGYVMIKEINPQISSVNDVHTSVNN